MSTVESLIRNPEFRAQPGDAMPQGWTAWKPAWEPASCAVRATPSGLRMDAPHGCHAVGGAYQNIDGVEGGRAYAIEARCEIRELEAPFRSLLVQVLWTREGAPLHPAGMLVAGPVVDGGTATFEDVLIAPDEADGARISLALKWPGYGSALWKRVTLQPTDPPPPRTVRVGTVYLRPKGTTPEQNRELFCEQIDAAGRLGLDIVCLGEAVTSIGTGLTGPDVAEPVPGPSTERFGKAARQNGLWVVVCIAEQDGDRLFNTALLLDRQGNLAGRYRKVHLPREEWMKGVTPGHEYPVFETDFGTIAIQICYDWFFPEPEAIFAMRGAEILFAPTWGNTLPDEDGRVEGENVFRVRARDNGLYIVPSVYDGSSLIIDPMGRILASNDGKEGVFWAEIDLNRREALPWVGYWRSIGPRHRMPHTYSALSGDPSAPMYGPRMHG